MSWPMIPQVWEKSPSKGSARTLELTLAIHANDCCGVAWPSDTTLYHAVNVSRQRIHELKHQLILAGRLVILARPGHTNLYFLASHGAPLGPQGDYLTTKRGQHQRGCPWQREVSEIPDPYPSEISDTPRQKSLTRIQENPEEKKEHMGALAFDADAAWRRRYDEVYGT